MDYKTQYKRWLDCESTDPELKQELSSLTDEKDIEDRFYRSLEFGTAGLRGIIGAGTNRMNVHIVRQATKALADYINSTGEKDSRGVAIAYDSRRKSAEFAKEAALVLCKNGIKVHLFSALHPVPMLSFAVKHINCTAGIVITASHNPPEYNGYKVYWHDGGQITPERCAPITELIEKTDPLCVKTMAEDDAVRAGLLEYIGEELDNAYYDYTMSLSVHKEPDGAKKRDIKVVYTPLHGSGLIPVTTLLSRSGYENVYVVEEQRQPDGNFPTVKAPNPENSEAFTLALSLAKEKDADIALATDPDSDRLGVCIKRDGSYTLLTGNKIGALLVNYILSSLKERGELPTDGFVVKSIVSTRLADKICEAYGVELKNVLTGFRYIAEQIERAETEKHGTFLFGFEESYGFLAGTGVRDKDACLTAMLVCEACAYYKARGMSLSDVLDDIENKYGAYEEKGKSFNVSGKDGMAKLADFMENMHKSPLSDIGGEKVRAVSDYKTGKLTELGSGRVSDISLPAANVICFELDNAWVCLRPSGTEPKLKLYVGTNDKCREKALSRMEKLLCAVSGVITEALG